MGQRQTIEGFHVTSHQANFASHHTRDRYVVSSLHRGVLEIQQNVLLLFIKSIPQYQMTTGVTRILAYTFGLNFNSFYDVNQKFKHFFCFSLYRAIQKGNKKWKGKIVRMCVSYRANPL